MRLMSGRFDAASSQFPKKVSEFNGSRPVIFLAPRTRVFCDAKCNAIRSRAESRRRRRFGGRKISQGADRAIHDSQAPRDANADAQGRNAHCAETEAEALFECSLAF